MPTSAHSAAASDPYQPARAAFDALTALLDGEAQTWTEAAIETALQDRAPELFRRLLQGHLDRRAAQERTALDRTQVPRGTRVRTRVRPLESVFGRVQVTRLGCFAKGHATTYPLDAALNLPPEVYSHAVRRRAAEEVRGHAEQAAVLALDTYTGAHVPKRQVQELTTRAAEDFAAFYDQRPVPANDTLSPHALEVMSCDSKGVRMIPGALREATRKAAGQAAQAVRGDPLAPRRTRPHDRRMAVVTANWEQEPRVRRPEDILRDLTAPRTGRPVPVPRGTGPRKDLPKPQHNTRVRASLVNDARTEVEAMFREADRRDPQRDRARVALVDGSESQLQQIRATAAGLDVAVTIILDVIHLLHYLWVIAQVLTRRDDGASEPWVREHLMRLMTRPAAFVISGIRQAATLRGLRGADRKAVDAAVGYLEKNAAYMDYGRYLRAGMPIATGIIEGACRHLVQDRMGITGACWGLEGAEAVLRLRALTISGDWDAYGDFHLQKEHERHYAKAA